MNNKVSEINIAVDAPITWSEKARKDSYFQVLIRRYGDGPFYPKTVVKSNLPDAHHQEIELPFYHPKGIRSWFNGEWFTIADN